MRSNTPERIHDIKYIRTPRCGTLLTTALFTNTAFGRSSYPISRLRWSNTQNFVLMNFPDEMESSNAACKGVVMNMVNVRVITCKSMCESAV